MSVPRVLPPYDFKREGKELVWVYPISSKGQNRRYKHAMPMVVARCANAAACDTMEMDVSLFRDT